MSDDLSKVDWGKPIEAYHEDGRVMTATIKGREVHWGQRLGAYSSPVVDGRTAYPGWRIRNVAEPVQTPSDDIAKRMEALVAKIAVAPNSAIAWFLRDEARALLAELAPVDPDVVEARQIAEGMEYCWSARDRMTANIDAAILAAIRRGRALERDSREG